MTVMDNELSEIFAKPVVTDLAPNDASSLAFAFPKFSTSINADLNTGSSMAIDTETSPTISLRDNEERLARTVFLGNLPAYLIWDRKSRRNLEQYLTPMVGTIESIRFRGVVPSRETLSKRVAIITGAIRTDIDSCYAYIVLPGTEEAIKAVHHLNGCIYKGRHLRADRVGETSKPDSKKSIFIGNLPLNIRDEILWNTFAECGPINYVRVIRDPISRRGKGIAYVAFQEKSSVQLALKLNGSDCEGRPMRITKCSKPGYKVKQQQLRETRASTTPVKLMKKKTASQRKSKKDSIKPKRIASSTPSTSVDRKKPKTSHRSTSTSTRIEKNNPSLYSKTKAKRK